MGETTAQGRAGRTRRHWSARDLGRALAPRLARSIAAAALTCLPVGVAAVLVRTQWDPLISADRAAIAAATDLTRDHPGLRDALIAWQEVFLPWHVYAAAVPVLAWVWSRGLRGRAIWGFITMMVGWNLGLDVKLLVQRARPLLEDPVSSAPGFSFPSGHAFNVAMAATTCVVLMWPLMGSRFARLAVSALAAVLIVVTALDRVYLGVHFPSDVVAGVLLALGLVAASWVGFMHQPNPARSTAPPGPPPETV